MSFDKFAKDYKKTLDEDVNISGESSEYFSEYKALYLKRYLGENFDGKICDYGCGVGLVLEYIVKHLPEAQKYGFDISEDSIEKAREKLKDRCTLFSDEKENKEKFDVVIVSNVLHHVEPKDRKEFILNVKSKLKEGGKLVIFEHNPLNPLTRYVVNNCAFDEDAVILYSGEGKSLLRDNGFNILKRDFIVFFPAFMKSLRFLEPYMSFLALGAQYVVVGERKSL